LVTIVRFNGKSSVLGKNEYVDFVKNLSKEFSVFFNNRGHQIQFVFYKDIDSIEFLEGEVQPQRDTARRLGLDFEDLIDESVHVNARYINLEETYLAFWSRPALLSSIESKLSTEEQFKLKKETNWQATSFSQNILKPISFLGDRHKSFVDTIVGRLNARVFGCSAEKLDVSEAIRRNKK
jgi:hypothetical protein